MKKRIFAILMCVVLSSIFCVGAFATGDIGIIGGADGDTQIIVDNEADLYGDEFFNDFDDTYTSGYYSFYEDEEFMQEVEKSLILSTLLEEDEETMQIIYSMGIDKARAFITCIIVAMIFGILFTPALIVLIIFAVLNSKAKKKIREYEMRLNPAYTLAGVPNNMANLNYQPQPVTQPQTQVNQTPIVNQQTQVAENTEGGEIK